MLVKVLHSPLYLKHATACRCNIKDLSNSEEEVATADAEAEVVKKISKCSVEGEDYDEDDAKGEDGVKDNTKGEDYVQDDTEGEDGVKDRKGENGQGKVGKAKVRKVKVGKAKVRKAKVRKAKVGKAKVGKAKVGKAQIKDKGNGQENGSETQSEEVVDEGEQADHRKNIPTQSSQHPTKNMPELHAVDDSMPDMHVTHHPQVPVLHSDKGDEDEPQEVSLYTEGREYSEKKWPNSLPHVCPEEGREAEE